MKLGSVAGAVLLVLLLGRGASATEKRPLPHYDGREPIKPSPLWWVPRVALFPLHVVSEYGLRKPIGAAVLLFDRNAAEGESTVDRFDVRPVIIADLGFVPRFGAQLVGRDDEHGFRIRGDTFGAQSYSLGAAAWGTSFAGRGFIGGYAELTRRPDTIFHGFGPRSDPDARVRIAVDRGEAGFRAYGDPSALFSFESVIGMRGARFRTPNIADDYAAIVQRLAATLDLRPLRRVGITQKGELRRGDGVRLEADAELATTPLPVRTFTTYGATLAATFDVTGRQRVLEISATARFMDPLSGSPPPYLEFVHLGDRYLRGHLPGRLHGRSAFVASASWTWPIWAWLDGFVRVDAGNVFGEHLAELAPKLFRLSATAGARNVGASGYVFEVLTGVGTEPIVDGARISSFRLLLNASRPF